MAERQFFRQLARLIGRRAARLSACGISAIVRKKGLLEEGCEVAVDGSLYDVSSFINTPYTEALLAAQKYPGFAQRIHQGLVDVLGEKGK